MRTLLLVLTLGCVATANAQPSPPEGTRQPVKEPKVCRDDTPIGSRLEHRTCRTKAEWANIDARTKDDAQQFTTMRNTSGSRGN